MVTVAGVDLTRTIQFTASASVTPPTYPVTFTEGGLPSGTSWSVTLNGTPQSSTSASMVFDVANGTLSYTVGAVSGYTIGQASGTITVAGHSVSETVQFTSTGGAPPTGKNNSTSSASVLGLPPVEGYLLIALIIVVLAILAAVAIWSRNRKKVAPNPPSAADPSNAPAPPPGAGGPPPSP